MFRAESQHRWNHPYWFGHFENKEVDYDENTRAMQKSIFDWSMRHNDRIDVGQNRMHAS
jgi:hypothetical protein